MTSACTAGCHLRAVGPRLGRHGGGARLRAGARLLPQRGGDVFFLSLVRDCSFLSWNPKQFITHRESPFQGILADCVVEGLSSPSEFVDILLLIGLSVVRCFSQPAGRLEVAVVI